MTVKVILKQPAPNGMKEFTANVYGILADNDPEMGITFLREETNVNIIDNRWVFKEDIRVFYKWSDIERLEVTP